MRFVLPGSSMGYYLFIRYEKRQKWMEFVERHGGGGDVSELTTTKCLVIWINGSMNESMNGPLNE